MMTKKILFLLTFLLTTLGGGNFALAEEVYRVTYDGSNVNTSSGSSAFATVTTFQATSSVAMYIGSGWGITSADITGNAAPQYSGSNWAYNNATNLPNAGAYLIFTPSVNGTFIFNGTKNGKNGNKYLTITTAVDEYVTDAIVKFNEGSPIEYNSGRVGYSLPDTKNDNYSTESKTPFTAEFSVIADKTYYVFVQTFSSWSFTGFTFRPQENYTTQIPINSLRYRPGPNGISASNGMDRSVGGFNLTFTYEAYDGIKCNNTNQLTFRSKYQSDYSTWNQGEMTIALDANNSNKTISNIELIYANNSLSASNITVSSGTLTDDTSNHKLVWTGPGVNSVTFTANYTADTGQKPAADITQINITTSAQPTFTPATPTIAFGDDAATTLTKKGSFYPTVETSPDNFMWEYSFADGSTGVTHKQADNSTAWTDSYAQQNAAYPAGILNASGVTATGNATLTATFSGNSFFGRVDNGDVYTLTVGNFAQFTAGNPYEWKFNDPTWWETTTGDFGAASSLWYLQDGIYKTQETLTDAPLYKSSVIELPETNNLLFTAATNGRLGVNVGNYIWMNGEGSKIKLPSLPVGTKITARIASHSGTQNPTIDGQSFAVGSGGRDCSVTLTETKQAEIVGGGGVNKIFYIKVEKGEPVLEKVSGSETFNLNNSTGDDASTHSLVLRVSKGIPVEDITVTVDPASGLFTAAPVKTLENGSEYNTLYISLTGNTVGTGKVTVSYAGNAGNLGFKAATPVVYGVQVMRQQQAYTWAFDKASYWTETTGDFLTQENSKWTNTTGTDYAVTTKVSDIELKAYTAVIPATKGLFVTASAGGVHLNIGNYMSLEGGSAASIRIPSLVAGQHVVFKTVADGGECGITTTSSNLRLVSGQPGLNGKDAYYTFHVTSDGDGVFTRTSTAANLQIKYIEVVGATTSCNEMKFININTSADVSNTLVSVASESDTAPFKLSWAGAGTVTYYVKDETVGLSVTGNTSDGTFTFSGTGTAKIEASLDAVEGYQKGYAVVYVSVKTPVTITLDPSEKSYTVKRGEDFRSEKKVNATASNSATVYWRSSNEAIARVDRTTGEVTNIGEGTVTITAYTEETETDLAAEASYTITYTPNSSLNFAFLPNSGLLNLSTDEEDHFILPYLNYADSGGGNITFDDITFESSDESIVTVSKQTGYGTANRTRVKITATTDASKVGQSAVVTAVGRSGSTYYYAAYTVTLTAPDECNFTWADESDIYIYEGDYMEIPDIIGNANGNESLSKSTDNKCGYLWDLKQNLSVVTNYSHYYKKDCYRGEGWPDYSIVQEGVADNDKSAYILFGESSESRTSEHPNTLLIYARKEGTVYLRATDSQNGTRCPDLTIHVMPKSDIYGSDGELTNEQQSVSYPYTWDFTRDFTSDEIAALDGNSFYWEKDGDSYRNGLALQNSDFGDDDGDTQNSGGTRLYKALLANHHTIPLFKGMKVQLQGSTYASKYHRITLKPTAGNGNSHLNVIGGPQVFQLPRPGDDQPEPSAYRVYFKVIPTGSSSSIRILVNGTMTDEMKSGQFNANNIYYKDITNGQSVALGFQDMDVYWIAMSTEANNTAKPAVNTHLNGAATTYSYGKALDLAKSEEVNNGLTAYYASSFTNGQNVASAVVLHQVTLGAQKAVPANTGLVLKTDAESTNYMIADAENEKNYTAPATLSGNYLVAGDGSTVSSTVGSGENIKTNFILSYAYKQFSEDGKTAVTDYQYDRDWSFYKVMPSAEVPVGKAYLQVNGNLRVKPDGTIETVKSAASRRAADGSNDDRPANKLMLDIVYEDEAHGFDATTAINDVKTDTVTVDDDAWYTIQGVRVNTPARGGIYIHNGRKVVIK